jgi:hypothetical protein
MQRFGSLAVRPMTIGDSAQNVYFRFTFAGLRRLEQVDVCDCLSASGCASTLIFRLLRQMVPWAWWSALRRKLGGARMIPQCNS